MEDSDGNVVQVNNREVYRTDVEKWIHDMKKWSRDDKIVFGVTVGTVVFVVVYLIVTILPHMRSNINIST